MLIELQNFNILISAVGLAEAPVTNAEKVFCILIMLTGCKYILFFI